MILKKGDVVIMDYWNNVRTSITEHKQKIELTQWAMIAGISSLFYSEYLRCMKRKEIPVERIMVPAIVNVNHYLNPNTTFMKLIDENFVGYIADHPLFKKYINAPELVLFKEENIELMKGIFDVYISPNISRRISETISKKFGLNDPKMQFFQESWDIHLFSGMPIDEGQIKFIVDQTVLQLLLLLPTMKKEVRIPENNENIILLNDEILTISNENAICPIHFDSSVFNNDSVNKLLYFVTNTTVEESNNEVHVTTGLFNQVLITKLSGIEYEVAN